MQKPVEKPIKFKKNTATFGKAYPITHIEAVVDGNGKTLPDLLELMLSTIPSTSGDIMSYTDSEGNTRYIASTDDPSGIVGGGGMTETTWLKLKALRDNSQLVAGSLYRITDYNCTTTQENTRSAGHQFDIVLLALSNNKLAEEGWAMMHDGVTEFDDYDIYNITFTDDVTKQFYLKVGTGGYNVVDVETFKGVREVADSIFDIMPDSETKTATMVVSSEEFINEIATEDFPYNYFQNSKLEAWKVWYCLDNDTDRFAWAMGIQPASLVIDTDRGDFAVDRYPEGDVIGDGYFAWKGKGATIYYTQSETPQAGDDIYNYKKQQYLDYEVSQYTAPTGGTGVIYRLIDEWNNDCPYDFKNIQFIRPMTNREYDPDGENTWVYTFSSYGVDEIVDLSVTYNDGIYATNNKIEPYIYNSDIIITALGNNVIFGCNSSSITGEYSHNNTILNIFTHIVDGASNVVYTERTALIYCEEITIEDGDEGFYINNKKVLTEE